MTLINLAIEDGLATLTLNREEKHNALNPEMIAQIHQAFVNVSKDASIKVVLVRGKGKSFCAGADLNWMKQSVDMSKQENVDSALALYDMYHAIYTCPKPLIGAIHGNAFGGGVGMIACMDVAVMHDAAILSLSELKLGLIPSTIAPFLLRKVGMKNLKYYGLCSQRIPAEEGKQIGLIHKLVDSQGGLEKEIKNYVDMFLQLSPQAIARYKKMCDDVQYLSLRQARELTSEEIADIRTTSEAQEGLRAFFEKRKPNWEQQSVQK